MKKSRGVAPIRENLVLGGKCFTNMYRELDRETIYFKRQMKILKINKSKISENLLKEVLFKSILYRLLNKVETFLGFGEIPSVCSLSSSRTI